MSTTAHQAEIFSSQEYMVRRKVLKLFGGAFHVYNPAGHVIAFCNMKAFKLKEDIRVYTAEDMAQEILSIQARNIIDFSASYDISDPATQQRVGTLRRRGFKSMFKDEWAILDAAEREIGFIREDSTLLALVRRFVDFAALLMPQKYHVEINGQPVAIFRQNFNPFVYKLNVDLTADTNLMFDPRLALASAILLAAIEGKQSSE